MQIRRLGWAGIEVIADDCALVVDYVHDFPLLTKTVGAGAYAAHANPAVAALVTHLHEDHTDVAAIESAVGRGGTVLRPAPFVGAADEAKFTEPNEHRLAAAALHVRIAHEWERVELGPFTVTAVPAVDGLGDPQVNWVIETGGRRILHGGDTIFHGSWWLIARRLGPIDMAVLPINGAVVQAPHLRPPSQVPAVLTPAQAVRAAVIVGAHTVLPIHFGVHQPPPMSRRTTPWPSSSNSPPGNQLPCRTRNQARRLPSRRDPHRCRLSRRNRRPPPAWSGAIDTSG